MATIEERAKDFADKGLPNNIEGAIRYTYIYAANEQQKIDIEKACGWLKENSETTDYQGLSSTCEMLFDSVDDMIAYFRKAMDE